MQDLAEKVITALFNIQTSDVKITAEFKGQTNTAKLR